MASSSLTPELLRLTSTPLSPFEYFTDSTNTINIKSDVTLIVGKERFYCHRLLLSLVSPVFSRMFDGEFKEHNEHEVTLEGKSSESILELLKYIYPQFNGQITNDNIEDFIQLADEYMIEHLKQPCKDVLLKQLQSFKYVLLPTQQKLEQPSMKSKNFHASDSALNSPRNNDGHSSHHGASNRIHSPRRTPSASTSRHSATKPISSYLKPGDKSGSSSNTNPRYVLFLDKNRMPTFRNEHNTGVPFTNTDVEVWIRRLRIFYQIDKGRNYGEVIDYIISILQFIPSNLLLPLTHITMDTYPIDEMMLNDIARARMYVLEDWAADGDPYRLVNLTESYRAMSPSVLVAIPSAPTNDQPKITINNEENSIESSMISSSDYDEAAAVINLNLTD